MGVGLGAENRRGGEHRARGFQKAAPGKGHDVRIADFGLWIGEVTICSEFTPPRQWLLSKQKLTFCTVGLRLHHSAVLKHLRNLRESGGGSRSDRLRGVGKMRRLVDASEEIQFSSFWAGTKSQFDEPFFDIGADNIRMILLQVVNSRAKLHHSAVLKPLRKALSESRRYQSAWISREK